MSTPKDSGGKEPTRHGRHLHPVDGEAMSEVTDLGVRRENFDAFTRRVDLLAEIARLELHQEGRREFVVEMEKLIGRRQLVIDNKRAELARLGE